MIRLSHREKLLVVAVAVLVSAWLLFAFAVKPAIERTETLTRVISEKQGELQKLHARSNEYIFLRDSLGNLYTKVSSQEKEFELLPFLESLIRDCGLEAVKMEQHVSQLDQKYYETIVEIRLEALTLRQLVDFFWKVESSEVLAKIKTLYIKKNLTNKDLLDSVVEIHNVKSAQS